jgi:hypothetical protein
VDLLTHVRLAPHLPILPRLTHVLAPGFRGQKRFLKESSAFSSTPNNEAGCAVTSFSAFSLAASSGIVISGSASTHSSGVAR